MTWDSTWALARWALACAVSVLGRDRGMGGTTCTCHNKGHAAVLLFHAADGEIPGRPRVAICSALSMNRHTSPTKQTAAHCPHLTSSTGGGTLADSQCMA